jgi:VanZ family protein
MALDTERRAASASWFPSRLRWTAWGVYVAAWTAALLTSYPVEVAHEVLPEEHIYSTSKTLHVSAYAVLTVLSGWLCVAPRRRWLLLLFLSAHAMGTEYLQGFVPMRGPSWADVGFDHVGIVWGLILSWKWWHPPVTP